jgi:hypothetical protein
VGGRQHGSIPDDHIAFVDFGQEDRPEVDRPDAIVGFFEAEVMLFERIGDEEQLVLEPERAGVGDPLDQEVPRLLERR